MVAYILLSLYGRVTAFLPSWCLSLLCLLLTRAVLLTSLRSRVERGMGQFPWTGDYDVQDLAQKHIRFLIHMFHNLLYIRYHPWPRRRLAKQVRCNGEDYLKEALTGNRGVILLSIHLGNFFWSIAHLSAAYPISLVVRAEKSSLFEDFARKLREKWRIEAIYNTAGAAFKIRNMLKNGEIVVFVVDQYIFRFFHGPDHPFKQILPRLVRMSGAPVIPFYTLEDKRHVIIRFLPPLKEVSPAVLEDLVIQGVNERPDLWFWWRRLGRSEKPTSRLDE